MSGRRWDPRVQTLGCLPDELGAEAVEFFAASFVVGPGMAEGGPERGRVIGVQKMGQLMRDDVVEKRRRGLHDAPAEAQVAVAVG